jgi:hypothetical protein
MKNESNYLNYKINQLFNTSVLFLNILIFRTGKKLSLFDFICLDSQRGRSKNVLFGLKYPAHQWDDFNVGAVLLRRKFKNKIKKIPFNVKVFFPGN